jgi:hypothetical protein
LLVRGRALRAAPKWYPLGVYMQTRINTPKGSQIVGSAHRLLNVGVPMISAFYTAGRAQTRALPCAGWALKSHASHWFLGSWLGRPINCCCSSPALQQKNLPFSCVYRLAIVKHAQRREKIAPAPAGLAPRSGRKIHPLATFSWMNWSCSCMLSRKNFLLLTFYGYWMVFVEQASTALRSGRKNGSFCYFEV